MYCYFASSTVWPLGFALILIILLSITAVALALLYVFVRYFHYARKNPQNDEVKNDK